MSAPRRGMGRGLDAILAISREQDAQQELRQLPVELIAPNPQQPRRIFDDDSLRALADSVGERGVLQPVIVRPLPGGRFELIAGERRWRAAKLAELTEIPAIIRRGDDAATLELALIENMAREDLNPVEEARACAALVEELGLTREEVGRRIGRGRVSVSNLLRILDLPEQALELLERRVLTEGHGRALLLADDHVQRRLLAGAAVAEGWSVRTLEARARAAGRPESQRGGSPRRRRSPQVHPDHQEAGREIAEALEHALRRQVSVRCEQDGSFRAELTFASAAEAAQLARAIEDRSLGS